MYAAECCSSYQPARQDAHLHIKIEYRYPGYTLLLMFLLIRCKQIPTVRSAHEDGAATSHAGSH